MRMSARVCVFMYKRFIFLHLQRLECSQTWYTVQVSSGYIFIVSMKVFLIC